MHTLLHNKVSVWLLGGFGLLSLFIVTETDWLIDFDTAIIEHVLDVRSDRLDRFFAFATSAAGFWGGITVLGFMSLWLIEKYAYKWLAMLWAVAIASFLLVDVLKLVFSRDRPDSLIQLVAEPSLGYPSGHTMVAVVIYGYIAYLIHLYVKTNRAQAAIAIAWVAFVLLISISRVYLGIHYFTDVVASWLLGGAILFALTHPKQSQKPHI